MLPVLLIEPVSYGKRRRYSEIMLGPGRWPQPTLEDIKNDSRKYVTTHWLTWAHWLPS